MGVSDDLKKTLRVKACPGSCRVAFSLDAHDACTGVPVSPAEMHRDAEKLGRGSTASGESGAKFHELEAEGPESPECTSHAPGFGCCRLELDARIRDRLGGLWTRQRQSTFSSICQQVYGDMAKVTHGSLNAAVLRSPTEVEAEAKLLLRLAAMSSRWTHKLGI